MARSKRRRIRCSVVSSPGCSEAPLVSVGIVPSKTIRASATIILSAFSFLPIWSVASSAREGLRAETPARAKSAARLRQRCPVSRAETRAERRSSAARTRLFRGVSMTCSSNRQAI